MSNGKDLYDSIKEVIGNSYNTEIPEDSYLMAEWESAAPIEQVKLFEAKEAVRTPNVSKKQLAEAMVEVSNSSYMTNVDRDPDRAIVASIQNFRTQSHLRETWQSMGKMIEEAHKRFNLDLKESLQKYNETQLNLLEMTLNLPWKLSYSEPVDVEVHDYPVAQENDPWKGKTSEEMSEDDDDVETHDIEDEEEDDEDFYEESYITENWRKELVRSIKDELQQKFGYDESDPRDKGEIDNIFQNMKNQYAIQVLGQPAKTEPYVPAKKMREFYEWMLKQVKAARKPKDIKGIGKFRKESLSEDLDRMKKVFTIIDPKYGEGESGTVKELRKYLASNFGIDEPKFSVGGGYLKMKGKNFAVPTKEENKKYEGLSLTEKLRVKRNERKWKERKKYD